MRTAELQQAFYEMVMQSQFWGASQLADYQRGQLEQLLRHARKNVPFYETRLDPVFRPDGSIDWSRWNRLPTVRRADMRQSRDAMQASVLPPGHGPTTILSTSGSTGLPIQITVNNLTAVANNSLRWRLHGWHGLDWSRALLSRQGMSEHARTFPHGEVRGPWGPPWVEEARRGKVLRISHEFDSRAVADFFRRGGASYLNTGPDGAYINAIDTERLGLAMKVDAVLAQGNTVRSAYREAVRRVWNAPLIEHYASKEGGQMAHPCPRDTLHVNGESCLVEVIDDDGEPCGPGETGRVVVTPFVQTSQPLIRYEQGDRAVVGMPCTCGRHSMTLASIVGRSFAIFRHPDGRSVVLWMPDTTTELLSARYWQLAQIGPNDYEMRYAPIDDSKAGDEPAVTDLFNQRFFGDATLRFVRLGDIPRTAGGKLVEYVNEWHPLN